MAVRGTLRPSTNSTSWPFSPRGCDTDSLILGWFFNHILFAPDQLEVAHIGNRLLEVPIKEVPSIGLAEVAPSWSIRKSVASKPVMTWAAGTTTDLIFSL
jgi:hypothetical protein